MSKISVVLSVYNEEKNIEDCLKSLIFADEIIVVDNGSLDNTVKLAKIYTDKIFSQKNDPNNIDVQKNFGFEKASNEWILSIDADEKVSTELADEIKLTLDNDSPVSGNHKLSIINHKSDLNGFWIPRKNYIFGQWIQNTGWYPDYQLRLFRKGKAKYQSRHVHEDISIQGETGKFKEHIIHNNYESILQFISKTLSYAPNEAENLIKKGYEFSHFDAIKLPLSEFLSRYFARKGYKDGFHGLMLSLFMAFYHFIIFAYIWEKKGFSKYNSKDFLKESEEEFKRAGKEIAYWVTKEKLDNIKNPLERSFTKIRSKLKNL